MPKNKSKNAFFFFMMEWKKRAEAEGRKFPNGLRDVQMDPDCNAEWQNLTKQQKGSYEAMAKKDKVTSQITDKDKKTSLGESISMLEEKEREQRKLIKDMQENIQLTVDSAIKLNALPKQKFCFIYVNNFFSTIIDNNIKYFPAEYSLGVFTLENGIEDVHHTIVSAKIPLGFRREALETSQSTHNIPVEYPGGETDFATMYTKLINFLEPRKISNKYPPLYTINSYMGQVQSLLARLSNAAQQDVEQFKVYELESLFISLANEAYKYRQDREIQYIPAYAQHTFTRYTYSFETGFECPFHKFVDGGSEYCSKAKLQQWAWTICEEFCESLGINKRAGVHYPIKSDSDISTLAQSINDIKVKDNCQSQPECNPMLSMTGVSEQHRVKVSSRTYQDEIRRRNESKQIQVVDYSKLNEPINEHVDKPVEECRKKYVSNYLSEKPMRPPNIDSCVVDTPTMNDYKRDENCFPVVGGRGLSFRKTCSGKAHLGKGHGHT